MSKLGTNKVFEEVIDELIKGEEGFKGIEWCVKGLALGRLGNVITWRVEDGLKVSVREAAESVVNRLANSVASVRILCRVIDLIAVRLRARVLSRGYTAALDLGCGGGAAANALTLNPRVRDLVLSGRVLVVGVDISSAMIRLLRKVSARVNGLVGNGESLPFRGEVFDEVTCFGVIHEVGDLRGLILNASRILRAGGYLTIIDKFSTPITWMASSLSRFFRRVAGKGFENPYLINEVLSAMRLAGLKPARVSRVRGGVGGVNALITAVKT